jgi:hypothetical protein
MPTKQISAQYLEGIEEGRKLFDWWKRDNMNLREQLKYNIELTQRVKAKVAVCAYSAGEIEFLDGELDFYHNQLKKLG